METAVVRTAPLSLLMPGRDLLTAGQIEVIHRYLAGQEAPVIGFDLDNTLVKCTEAYVEANAAFIALVCRVVPSARPEAVAALFDQIDTTNKKSQGVSRTRYPGSMVETLDRVGREHGVRISDQERADAYAVGDSVFSYQYPPYPGVVEMLRALTAAGARLALCTKGDPVVQDPKIDRWGLREFFVPGAIVIRNVSSKSPQDVADALSAANPTGDPRGYFVGDSLRDDIQSANAVGAISVHKPYTGARAWSYEDGFDHVVPTFRITETTDLPTVVAVPGLEWDVGPLGLQPLPGTPEPPARRTAR